MEFRKDSYELIKENTRKVVYQDIERHFSQMETLLADEAISQLSYLPFTQSLSVNYHLSDYGQYDLIVGMPDDEFQLRPFWKLSTGVNTSITIFMPTVATGRSQFYREIVEHMLQTPATDDMIEWWSNMNKPLPSRITIDFSDQGVALCEVILDLCRASIVVSDSWDD